MWEREMEGASWEWGDRGLVNGSGRVTYQRRRRRRRLNLGDDRHHRDGAARPTTPSGRRVRTGAAVDRIGEVAKILVFVGSGQQQQRSALCLSTPSPSTSPALNKMATTTDRGKRRTQSNESGRRRKLISLTRRPTHINYSLGGWGHWAVSWRPKVVKVQ